MTTPNIATPSRSVTDLVLQEQIALTCKQYGIMAASSSMAYAMGAYLFYGKLPTTMLILWLSVNTIGIGSMLMAVYIVARKRHGKFYPVRRWTTLITSAAFVSGCSWGSAGVFLFVPNSLVDQQFLLILLLVPASMGAIMLTAYPPAFYAGLVPLLLPIGVRFLSAGNAESTALAIIIFAFGTTLAYLYKNIHRTFLESLQLRFEVARTAEALVEQKNRAEQANLAKSRFLAAASHDLRQPLHAQGLLVEELHAANQDAKNQGVLANLKNSIDAMHDLFNALLDMSRLEANVVKPKYESFSINVTLRELRLDFSPIALKKKLTLCVIESSAVVHSDSTLLKQILRNLVSNAVRYTNQGKVLVGCRRRGDRLRIEVWDTGIGIAAEDQASIFEEFHQLHNPERDRRKGLGLGLAIVNRAATLLQCPVDVRSRVNKGSVFSITVPFAGTTTKEIPPPSIIVDRNSDLSGRTILVVDDNPEILQGMKGLLEQWGCRVLIAESSAQAAAQVRTTLSCPAAIIADYRLCGHETGIQAIAFIRSLLGQDVPGLLITGDTAPERLQEAYASGYQILHKPVPPAKLRALLGHVIRTHTPIPEGNTKSDPATYAVES